MTVMNTFTGISKRCESLVKKLNWQTYHTPENLVSILVSEVGELSELCVWLSKAQIQENEKIKKDISEEFADVVKAMVYFYNSLHLDISIETLISSKLDLEDSKYPVGKYLGKSKYEKLTVKQAKAFKKSKLPTKNIDPVPTINMLESRSWSNAKDRNWDDFYTPATLCLAIFEDCSKIYTSFQRRTTVIDQAYYKMVWAVAGILILCLRLHTFLELENIGILVKRKLDVDIKRFS